jgi:uroporphyrin-III C-methyltransferase/precorrin-2 dehydrogenase/sirohydrochlorin ferrochelatase/uroporphyrin-III C-methyltransferase
MSSETLDKVVEKLTANNIHEDKLLAVAEQATTPLQNIHICNLYDYKNKLKGRKFISPSLVIIGKVVSLHEKFRWLQNNNIDEYYFKPMKNNPNPLHQTEKIYSNVS